MCASHPIRVEVLDEIVWEQVQILIDTPELVLQEYSRRRESKRKGNFELEEILSKKKKEMKHQEHEKQRLLDPYQTRALRLQEIEERLKNIRKKITQIEEEECSLLNREEKIKQDQLQLIEQFEEFKKRINQNGSNLNFEDRKKVVRLLVSEIIVDVPKEEIVIRQTVPTGKSLPLCTGSKQSYLDEFVFRFNRRTSGNRGLLFTECLKLLLTPVLNLARFRQVHM